MSISLKWFVFCLCCVGLMGIFLVHRMARAERPPAALAGEFKIGKHGRPLLVRGSVRGKPVTFLVDTGASRTGFDASLRPLLGESLGKGSLETDGGVAEAENFNCPEIVLGGLAVKSEQPVFCHDMQGMQAAAGDELSGVLGMDILGQFVLSIDFEQGVLRLFRELPGNANNWGTPFRLSFRSSTPTLVATSGPADQVFIVDTGSTDNCIETGTFDQLVRMRELRVGPQYSATTPFGQRPASIGLLQRFSLGPFVHEGLLFDEGRMNLLGLSYLSRYAVTLDFPHSTAYLSKGKQYAKTDLRGSSGVSLNRVGGRLIVKGVRPGGPAAKAGIQAGDEIAAINGETSENIDMFRARQLLTSGAGRNANMKLLRDGQVIQASFIIKDRLAP